MIFPFNASIRVIVGVVDGFLSRCICDKLLEMNIHIGILSTLPCPCGFLGIMVLGCGKRAK